MSVLSIRKQSGENVVTVGLWYLTEDDSPPLTRVPGLSTILALAGSLTLAE